MIKPRRLHPGSRVAIVAPSSPLDSKHGFQRGLNMLRSLGLKPVIPRGLHRRRRFLAGSDQHRADVVNAMFEDDEVDGIICMRGGDGAARILPLLNYDLIKRNPKCLIGYSDITALNLALWSRIRLVSFSGAMVANGWNSAGELTCDSFTRLVSGEKKLDWEFRPNFFRVMTKGTAQGRLVGGNLTVMAGLTGTAYFPSTRGAILFIEDVDEKPERIDRMLTNLRLAGAFDSISAVLLGHFINCAGKQNRQRDILNFVLKDNLADLGVPVVAGLPFGHIRDMLTMPIGVKVSLDTRLRRISILERAVK